MRFPRPDLDLAALKKEQQMAERAPHWLLVTSEERGPEGTRCKRMVLGEGTNVDPLDTSDPQMQQQPQEQQQQQQQQQGGWGPPTGPSDSTVPSFFSDGTSDWRYEITEEFDADWAWLSGGPWAADARGPLGAPSPGEGPHGGPHQQGYDAVKDRLQDKRLKVYVQGINITKPIAILNRHQVLQTLQHPHVAMGISRGTQGEGGPPGGPKGGGGPQGGPQGYRQSTPLTTTLCPEAYEALIERTKRILPSFKERQQVLLLLQLLLQHTRALQQQHRRYLQEQRALLIQANAAATAVTAAAGEQQEQQQQHHHHQQLLLEQAAAAAAAAAEAARSLRALQQQQLYELLFDATLPHMPHMPLEELGNLSRVFAYCAPTKGLGMLQVVALHAFDRSCSSLWGPPPAAAAASAATGAAAAAADGGPQENGLLWGVLQVLQPFALGLQRQGALGAPMQHSRAQIGGPPEALPEIGGPLAAVEGGPQETGGGLGCASRRLIDIVVSERGVSEFSSLSRGSLLQLLLCCCCVGSGASVAPMTAAKQCLNLLFRGPQGPLDPEFSLDEALWVLISCAYRESRGGPPAWLLPLFMEMWGPSSSPAAPAASAALLQQSPDALLGPAVAEEETGAVRCSPPLGAPGGPLLTLQQLQSLLQVIQESLLPEGSLGAPTEKQQQPPLPQPLRLLPGSAGPSPDGGPPNFAGLDSWMIELNVCQRGGPQGAPTVTRAFDYLEDPGAPKYNMQTIRVPAVGALAAVEALGWSLSQLLQHQQQQQQQQDHQQQKQQHLLQESIKRAHDLLLSILYKLSEAAANRTLSISALLQGAHILADAAEHFKGGLSAGASPGGPQASALQQEFEAQSALVELQAACGRLLLAAGNVMQGGAPQGAPLESLISSVCCCVVRFLEGCHVGGAPRSTVAATEARTAVPAAAAHADAAAALATGAAQCLQGLRLLLGGPPSSTLDPVDRLGGLSLRTQAEWLGALGTLMQRAPVLNKQQAAGPTGALGIYEEAAATALSAGPHAYSSTGTDAAAATTTTTSAAATAAEATAAAAAERAAQGLNALLDQLARASSYASDQEVSAAAELARQLQQMQQQVQQQVQQQLLQQQSVGFLGALSRVITGMNTARLEQLQQQQQQQQQDLSSNSSPKEVQKKPRETLFVAVEPA
ncbi:hypothetical protein, conserved [Eimeria maxima]|uniref:Uncharacterized protein n=1 Tax=Eimeria maxima TaxID=5804 RepID=U6LYP0_EIMMA|nr:hypothetical protein, conserved [Eimeria maxima]CDJ55993.1 hypothetical protein, conserved [Eimeria maxima]